MAGGSKMQRSIVIGSLSCLKDFTVSYKYGSCVGHLVMCLFCDCF